MQLVVVRALEDARVQLRDRLGVEGLPIVEELKREHAESPHVHRGAPVPRLTAAHAAVHTSRAHKLGRKVARRATERVQPAR